MKNNKYKDDYVGMGLTGVLSTIFIVLKLCNLIDWSWIWVLSPIWITIAFYIIIIGIYLIIYKVNRRKYENRSMEKRK